MITGRFPDVHGPDRLLFDNISFPLPAPFDSKRHNPGFVLNNVAPKNEVSTCVHNQTVSTAFLSTVDHRSLICTQEIMHYRMYTCLRGCVNDLRKISI